MEKHTAFWMNTTADSRSKSSKIVSELQKQASPCSPNGAGRASGKKVKSK